MDDESNCTQKASSANKSSATSEDGDESGSTSKRLKMGEEIRDSTRFPESGDNVSDDVPLLDKILKTKLTENTNSNRKNTSNEDLVAAFENDITDTEAGPSSLSASNGSTPGCGSAGNDGGISGSSSQSIGPSTSVPSSSGIGTISHALSSSCDEEDGSNDRITKTETRANESEHPQRKVQLRNYRRKSSDQSESSNGGVGGDDNDDEDDDDDDNFLFVTGAGGDVSTATYYDSSSSSSSSTSYTLDTLDILGMNDSESSSNDTEHMSKDELQEIKKDIFQKPKPKYTWTALREIYYRQNGLTGRGHHSVNGNHFDNFINRTCGSLHVVERLDLLQKLEKHRGCVNCLNFNKSGNLLVTGSDDLSIIIWKWSTNQIEHLCDSGHTSNVFQTKFVDFLGSGLNVVSSSRDGHIRHHMIPPSGSKSTSVCIAKHVSPVHKVNIVPNSPYEVLSASEDGIVLQSDLRDRKSQRLVFVKSKGRRVSLYSVHHHPLDPEFCVCGQDSFVRVYDKRNCKNPTKLFCANRSQTTRGRPIHITNAVYNYIGTEILASCNDDIYLYDNVGNNSCGEYLHKYSGHRNSLTIKGVSFFGPRSEFIMSGSDCGHCFFWDKETESIVQWMKADKSGAVNCLESHPNFPIIATSGVDYDVKLWAPLRNEKSPMTGLERRVTRNLYLRNEPRGGLFDRQLLGFYVRQCMRNDRLRRNLSRHVLLSSSDDSSDERNNGNGGGGDEGNGDGGGSGGGGGGDDDDNNDNDSESGAFENGLVCSPS